MDETDSATESSTGAGDPPAKTSWHLIAEAATGIAAAKETFAARYAPPLRAYFQHRWRGHALAGEVEDAVQEVFVDCFKEGGVLQKADAQAGGFRTFLYGVARMTARHFEQARTRKRELQPVTGHGLGSLCSDETSLSRAFDKAWAKSIVRQAVEQQREHAASKGKNAQRRVEVLHLRFQEAMPLREIARHLGMERTQVYKDIARGKEDFYRFLTQAVALHFPGAEDIEQECVETLRLLE